MIQQDQPDADAWRRILTRLPWWLWLLFAVAAYVGVGRLIAPGAGMGDDPGNLIRVLAGLGQWLIPAAFLAAAAAALWCRRRATPPHRASAADPVGTALGDLGHGDFDTLVAEAFRLHGYQVTKTGDPARRWVRELLLDRGSERALVHTRQWQAWQVGVAEVQALIAAMPAARAGHGYLVVPGEFTRDAYRLARGNAIDLIDGAGLRHLVGAARGEGAAKSVERPARPLRLRRGLLSRLAGAILAVGAILSGFSWITHLPDKRISPPPLPTPTPPVPVRQAPTVQVPEPSVPAATSRPAPQPGPGPYRSIQEMDDAFEAFYVPPPGCASPASLDDMVACANDRIRARRSYMAPAVQAEPETEPEAQGRQDDALTWGQAEPVDRPPEPPPGQAEMQVPREDAADTTPPAENPTPKEPPKPDDWKDKDPAATYAPYDPKAPWTQP